MNETERLLKLQNAVKMMIADGKTPAYIDTFLAKQNSLGMLIMTGQNFITLLSVIMTNLIVRTSPLR